MSLLKFRLLENTMIFKFPIPPESDAFQKFLFFAGDGEMGEIIRANFAIEKQLGEEEQWNPADLPSPPC